MKRGFTLLFCMLLIGGAAFAQSLQPYPSDSVHTSDAVVRKAKGHVINSTDSAISVRWLRAYESQNAAWATPGVCDNKGCTFSQTDTFLLQAKDTGDLQIWFQTNEVDGSGEVHLRVYNDNDSANTSFLYIFTGDITHKGGTSSAYPKVLKPNSIMIAPNPAKDMVSIINNRSDLQRVEIYNILGIKVSNHAINNATMLAIPVSGLEKGMYFLRFINNEGDVVQTRSLVKAD